MRRPLFIILPIYILGITFGTVFRGNFLPLYFASAITLITHVVLGNRNKLALIFLALAIFLTAAASYSGSVLLPLNHISRVIAAGERTVPCLVKGFAYGNPIKRGGKVISGFKVRAMQRGPANVNVEGDILIRVAGNAELPVGMLFSAKGKLVRVNDYRRRNLFNTAYRYLMSADYIYL